MLGRPAAEEIKEPWLPIRAEVHDLAVENRRVPLERAVTALLSRENDLNTFPVRETRLVPVRGSTKASARKPSYLTSKK